MSNLSSGASINAADDIMRKMMFLLLMVVLIVINIIVTEGCRRLERAVAIPGYLGGKARKASMWQRLKERRARRLRNV